jgi:nucleoid DNA-binding protein
MSKIALGEELKNISADVLRLVERLERVREAVSSATAELSARASSEKAAKKRRVPSRAAAGLRTSSALTAKVQDALALNSKKEAEAITAVVFSSLEQTLSENLDRDGFAIKLGSFGKFSIRHKPGVFRKIGFTGESKMTSPKRKVRFVVLGRLRRLETAR